MTWRMVRLAVGALLVTLTTAGCGVKEKAEFAIILDANASHPEFMRAAARTELASLLALMRPTAAQAASWSAWATDHGNAIRAEVDNAFATMAAASGDITAAGDELLANKIDTVAGQKKAMDAKLGDKAGIVSGEDEPVSMEKLVEPHLASVEPLAKALTDRQTLILTGHWKDASDQVIAIMTSAADDEELEGHRANLTMIILDGRGRGADPDDPSQAKVDELVKAIKTGQASADAADAEVAKLFGAVTNGPDHATLDVTAPTLATVLSQRAAVELLGLVK